jgi:hypothetical protein
MLAGSPLPAGTWQNPKFSFERTADNKLYYKSIIIDGIGHTLVGAGGQSMVRSPISNGTADCITFSTTLRGDANATDFDMWFG